MDSQKFINRLPDGQFEFLSRLRALFLAAHPEMTEKLHFSTPFYSLHGWLAYWSLYENGSLEVNFLKGYLMEDKQGKLVARKRKVVRGLMYETPADFDEDYFKEILAQAVALNPPKKKSKKKFTGHEQ